MDDPTRRCENDTGNESHSPGPPIPSGGLIFVRTYFRVGDHFCLSPAARTHSDHNGSSSAFAPASEVRRPEQL